MGTLILLIAIVFLAGSLFLACAETRGGYLGDSSLVPGCLGVGALVIAAVIVVGVLTGRIGFWIN